MEQRPRGVNVGRVWWVGVEPGQAGGVGWAGPGQGGSPDGSLAGTPAPPAEALVPGCGASQGGGAGGPVSGQPGPGGPGHWRWVHPPGARRWVSGPTEQVLTPPEARPRPRPDPPPTPRTHLCVSALRGGARQPLSAHPPTPRGPAFVALLPSGLCHLPLGGRPRALPMTQAVASAPRASWPDPSPRAHASMAMHTHTRAHGQTGSSPLRAEHTPAGGCPLLASGLGLPPAGWAGSRARPRLGPGGGSRPEGWGAGRGQSPASGDPGDPLVGRGAGEVTEERPAPGVPPQAPPAG